MGSDKLTKDDVFRQNKVIKKLRKLAAKHIEINEQMNELLSDKEGIRKLINKCLDFLGRTSVDVHFDEKYNIRCNRYSQNSISYDAQKLIKLLRQKGRKDLIKRVIKPTVDTNALTNAYNHGDLTAEEIASCVLNSTRRDILDVRKVLKK